MTARTPIGMLRAHPGAFAAVALLLVITGAYQAQASYHEEVRKNTSSVSTRWAEDAGFDYGVYVVRNATLWPLGTRLPMGEPAYYRSVADGIHVNFTWAPTVPATGIVESELVVRVRADAREGGTYWSFEEPLNASAAHAFDGPIELRGFVDLDDLVPRVEILADELPPGDGRINWTVVARVTYALDVMGIRETSKSVFELPIEVQDPRFFLPAVDAIQWDKRHDLRSSRVITTEARWAGVATDLRAQALMGLGAIGIAAAVWARTTDPTRGLAAREAAFRLEHIAQREWVTTARRPILPRTLPGPIVDVGSLADLVQVAADARTRVLLDPYLRVYYVTQAGMTYRYARHGRAGRPS